jgi:AcrR family transcriptional regulator
MARPKKNENEIKLEIINTAQKLFQKYGFVKTTMEDIAKALKKGKSTLYHYYESKELIFEDVVNKEADEVNDIVKKKIASLSNASDKLRAYFLVTLEIIKEKTNLYSIIFFNKEEDLNFLHNIHFKYQNRDLELIKEILSFGIENKEFSFISPHDLDILAYIISISMRGVLMDIILVRSTSMLDHISNKMVDIFLRGIK